jgi:hypothetical protein
VVFSGLHVQRFQLSPHILDELIDFRAAQPMGRSPDHRHIVSAQADSSHLE